MVPIGMVVTTVTDFQFHVSPEDFFGNTATVVGAVIQPVWEERRKVITNSLYLFIYFLVMEFSFYAWDIIKCSWKYFKGYDVLLPHFGS